MAAHALTNDKDAHSGHNAAANEHAAPDSTHDTQQGHQKDAHGGDHGHGDSAHEDGHAEAHGGKVALLDLSDTITPEKVGSVLDNLANEPGEYGQLKFELGVAGKVPVAGILKAKLELLGEMTIQYSMNDQNNYNIAIDWEAAAGLGLELGLGKNKLGAGVEVGFGGDFVNKSFGSSTTAAAYLLFKIDQFINHTDAGPLLQIVGVGGHEPHADFEMHDKDTFVKAKAGGQLGDKIEGEVSYTAKHRETSLHVHEEGEEEKEYKVHVDFENLDAALKVKLGKHKLDVHYSREWSNTVGSPIYYSNGVFINHNLTFAVPLSEASSKGASSIKPSDNIKGAILGLFMQSKLRLPESAVLDKAFQQVAKGIGAIDVETKSKSKSTQAANIMLQWNEYGESDGSANLMYMRVFVVPTISKELELEAGVLEAEAEASASKAEVLYEYIGNDTVSYIQRQFVFGQHNGRWSQFKTQNKKQLYGLVENMADPTHLYYAKSVEQAFKGAEGKETNYEAGLAAIEQHWRAEEKELKEIKLDINKISAEFGKTTKFFFFASSRREAEQHAVGSIVRELRGYKHDPLKLAYMIDFLPAYAVDIDALAFMAAKTHQKVQFNALMQLAIDAGSKAARLSNYVRVRHGRGTRWEKQEKKEKKAEA